jgi:hypothetical protein
MYSVIRQLMSTNTSLMIIDRVVKDVYDLVTARLYNYMKISRLLME